MACLHKIQICGIRSFSPQFEDAQSVVFEHPLTVILGRNGAGKTTIIEACLNATTGELPVGADKGSFVHDPRILGEREVRGQIRMTFRANTGQDMQVTRTFQSRFTKNKVVSQTIDASLAYKDAVTKKTTSGTFRCSDIDKIIPDLLGVSPSVLTNVIFCHQEDANWCFGTPAEVKKRLDDIFSSTKYVGALEKLKESGKHYKQEVKQCEALLLLLEEHCTQAQKLRSEIEDKEQKADELSKRALILQSEYDKVAAAVSGTDVLFAEIAEARDFINRLDVIIRDRNRSVQNIKENLDPSTLDSDQHDVERLIKANESEISRLEEQKVRLEADLQEINALQSRIASSALTSELELRQTTDQWNGLNRKEEEVRQKLQTILSEMGHTMPDIGLNAFEYTSRLQQISSLIKANLDTYDTEWSETKTRLDSEMQVTESKQNVLYAEHSRVEAQNEDILRQMQDEEQMLSVKIKERDDLNDSVLSWRTLEEEEKQNVVHLENDLLQFRNSLAGSGYEEAIASLEAQIKNLEREVETVNAEMRSHAERKDSFGRGAFLRSSKEAKKKLMEGKVNAASHTRGEISLDTLSNQLSETEKLQTEKAAEYKEFCSKKLLAVEKCISSQESALRNVQNVLSNKTKDMQEKVGKLQEIFGEEIHMILSNPHDHMTAADVDCERLSTMLKETLTKREQSKFLVKHFKEKAECFTCGRGFRTKPQSEAFLQRIEYSDEASSQKDIMDEEEKAQSRRNALRASYADLIQCDNTKQVEIPSLESESSQAEESLRKLYEDRKEAIAIDAKMQAERLELDERIAFMREIRVLQDEICELDKEIQATGDIDNIEGKSLSDICQSHADLQNRIRTLRKQQNDLKQQQSEVKRQIESIQQALSEKRSSLQNLEMGKVQLAQLTECISTIQARIETLKLNHQENSQRATETEKAKAENQAFCTSLKAERESHERRLSVKIATWSDAHSIMTKFAEEVNMIHLDETRGKINTTRAELEKHRSDKEKLHIQERNARESLENVQNTYRWEVSRHEVYEKALNYHRIRAEVKGHQEESASALDKISSVESQIRSIFRTVEPVNTTDDVFPLLGKLHDRLSEIQTEAARLKGNVEPLVADISHRQASLLDTKYEDIERRMASTSIKLQTSQLVVTDIEKYYKALDHAVTKYHMDKITDLNTIIENLWRSTYAGSDIDAIAIHVDEDANSTMSRRSFKYRVVMTKGDVELDLRGRCSAGQKVLASVIIRLALSEAFCCDCGILALDEPTTNLDEENVIALARALRNIIESRRNVKNFQLIVITHDESFVRALGHSTMCDSYYYVHKTVDGKYSQVDKQPITGLFA